ncbi:MAG TPA: phosphate ABC transporter substrate-binding protein PstS [Nocardioidaceae bacterium]|nr:phosphate ABC transporter substrate-binding protein PstS [Nocardioidaceae bacterium]
MNATSTLVLPALAAALGLALIGCGAANETPANADPTHGGSALSGTLDGAGSSAQQAAQAAWQAHFQSAHPGVTVNYDPVGSGAGVDQFLSGGVAFAGSDKYLTADQLTASKKTCHGATAFDVPDYVSPIAIAYHLDGVDHLKLSPKTAAGIFAGTITKWNDPAIQADNPGARLPSSRITPVHRSDDSGTTNNFTDYLHQTAPSVWTDPAAETWPYKSGEAAQGTSGVVAAIKSGNGTIGYADRSQVGALSVASVKVGSRYVAPSPTGAAKALADSSTTAGRPAGDLAIQVNRTTTSPGAYPILLVSYLIACPSYPDSATGTLVKTYLGYVVSGAGQQAAAQTAGSAPLPGTLASKAASKVQSIGAGH